MTDLDAGLEPPHAGTGSKVLALSVEEGSVTLAVTVSTATRRLIVTQAAHTAPAGTPAARVFDALCVTILQRPLQEASDHGAIFVMDMLPDDIAKIAGIRTPRNAGPAFALAERLMRKVHAAACEQLKLGHAENRWVATAGPEWLAKSEADQAGMINPILANFLREHGLTTNDAWISRIDRGTRITMAFSDVVSYALKPKLMLDFERRLRAQTGYPLELFLEEKKDGNKVRRL